MKMKHWDLVRVTTDARPKGLVPDKLVTLICRRRDGRWYAVVETQLPITCQAQHTVDSGMIIQLSK